MELLEVVKKLSNELKAEAKLGDDGLHYIPVKQFEYYLELAAAVGFDLGRKDQKNRKPIYQMLNGKVIQRFDSLSSAAIKTGGDVKAISKVLNHKNRTSNGYQWVYVKTIS